MIKTKRALKKLLQNAPYSDDVGYKFCFEYEILGQQLGIESEVVDWLVWIVQKDPYDGHNATYYENCAKAWKFWDSLK